MVCGGEPKPGKVSMKPDLGILNLHPDLKPAERQQIEALDTQFLLGLILILGLLTRLSIRFF